jgi:hypothetical protein
VSKYDGEWKHWVHRVSNGRWIVCQQRGEYWYSRNTVDPPGELEVKGHNQLDLVGKGIRTYATVHSAIRALKRVYPELERN